ncbi:class I SAM-dependent methyltransferase [Microlunatus endophyticus]|uniref:class I SAM-dependent methyltransferase n=1 Tax=Microlunatus endophyticus TaxID=1716077 RepID=UPI00166F216F|nr:class I SAM-dependent methyltransferase [Microlunatus endophyticus]
MTTDAWDKTTTRNSAYWEALAPHRHGEPVDFFRQGGNALTDQELAAIGEVRDRRVMHLACSMGDEAITFAQLGARVTGVDIAPSHLEIGRAKADQVGVTIDFVQQDMMALDHALTDFDLIYISWGGICWVPDLEAWARSLAGRLNPGGLLVISEHHPLWEILSAGKDGTLSVSGDYFHAAREGYPDPDKAPQITREIGAPAQVPVSYVWNLGAVVRAVVNAGLTVRSLEEFPDAENYPHLGAGATRLPATYLLTASKRP